MNPARAVIEADLARLMQPLARRLRAAANDAVASLDLSEATGWALLQISRLGGETSQADLAAALDISGASLVRLLARLEQRGLLARAADVADRRTNRVTLTSAGRDAAGRIEDLLRATRRTLFAPFSDEELQVAMDFLATVDRRLGARRPTRS